MSLPAMTFGDRFCFSRKGGIGKGGWVVQTAWLSLGSTLETPWLALGGPLLSSYAQAGLENSHHGVHGTHFQWGSMYPSQGERFVAECHNACQLVHGW